MDTHVCSPARKIQEKFWFLLNYNLITFDSISDPLSCCPYMLSVGWRHAWYLAHNASLWIYVPAALFMGKIKRKILFSQPYDLFATWWVWCRYLSPSGARAPLCAQCTLDFDGLHHFFNEIGRVFTSLLEKTFLGTGKNIF